MIFGYNTYSVSIALKRKRNDIGTNFGSDDTTISGEKVIKKIKIESSDGFRHIAIASPPPSTTISLLSPTQPSGISIKSQAPPICIDSADHDCKSLTPIPADGSKPRCRLPRLTLAVQRILEEGPFTETIDKWSEVFDAAEYRLSIKATEQLPETKKTVKCKSRKIRVLDIQSTAGRRRHRSGSRTERLLVKLATALGPVGLQNANAYATASREKGMKITTIEGSFCDRIKTLMLTEKQVRGNSILNRLEQILRWSRIAKEVANIKDEYRKPDTPIGKEMRELGLVNSQGVNVDSLVLGYMLYKNDDPPMNSERFDAIQAAKGQQHQSDPRLLKERQQLREIISIGATFLLIEQKVGRGIFLLLSPYIAIKQ